MSGTSAQTMRAAGAWWMPVAVAVLSLAVAVLGCEALLRLVPLRAAAVIRDPEEEVHPSGLYALHPEIGWTLTPGFRGRFRKGDFDIEVTANAQGLREHDISPKPPGTYRILGLGDSFAFGWGVEAEESFLKVLQARLNADGRRLYEVVNAGIPGFGTYEALRLLEVRGLSYEPDAVILAFYEGNDFQNNREAPRRRMITPEGYLKDVTDPSPALTQHSRLAALVHGQWARVHTKRGFAEGVRATQSLLQQMHTLLEQRRIPLALVLIPDQDAKVYGRAPLLRLYDRVVGGMELSQARRELEAFCRNHGIWFYQLSDRFGGDQDSSALRLNDTHFNPAGHRAAAEEIHRFLERSVLAAGDAER
ncbi:MAG: hypothetical protein HY599_00595, partial [Candidatus Omnitrophica bacterium]|nr:hypothetical protein [Candidatus Omnitrophota bacterium]